MSAAINDAPADAVATGAVHGVAAGAWSDRGEDRALELQSVLAEGGQHRAPSVPDLLIAATAELAGPTVLHVDKDFELIAEVTGQRVERLDIG